jgi:PAS domain-containing protein
MEIEVLKTQKKVKVERIESPAPTYPQAKGLRGSGYDTLASPHSPLYTNKLEEELRRQRSWLETTLRFLGDGVLVADQQERVSCINEAALAILETTREAALGRPLNSVLKLRYHWSGLPVEDLAAIAGGEEHPVTLPLEIDVISATGKQTRVEGAVAACRVAGKNSGCVVLFSRRRPAPVRRARVAR